MFKIIKFAKKSWYVMILIILLLFVQANCELALPQYTSNIVDVGIQYKGIETPIPDKMRNETYEHLKLFLEEDGIALLEKYYENSLEEGIYHFNYNLIKKDTKEEQLTQLKEALVPGESFMALLTSHGEKYVEIQNKMLASMGLDASKTKDIFEVFGTMPPEAIQAMKTNMNEKMGDMAKSTEESMAIAFIQNEYKEMGVNLGQFQTDYLKKTGIQMLLLALLGMVVSIAVAFLSARMAAKTSRDLRNQVFQKVMGFSNGEMNQFSTASLITRSTNDVQQVQMVLTMMFRIVAYAPIMGIGGIIKVLNTRTSMTWIIAVAVLAILCIVGVLMTIAMPKFKKMQVLLDRLNLVSREILTGIPVIRAFSREKHEEKRFEVASRDLMKTQLFTNRVMTFMMPTMMFIMNGITVLILWVGAHGIEIGNLQVGDMMAFITYTMQIVMSFLMITMISIMLPRAAVSATRIDEILNCETQIVNPEKPRILEKVQKGIRFENVSFCYNQAKENVLENINFLAAKGETTAIIGSTGCGKSTLVNLIPRLYDVTEGKITIDDVDIRDMDIKNLREKIGFVPQKGILFSGTIASNINFGVENPSMNNTKEAAEIAQAAEFIKEKPDGYEENIAQGGNNVSGGQKQRLAIARAIAKRPDLYVFDDSFSALDYKTDIALRKALYQNVKDAVVIIVAQRISTIIHADKIIVLDDGKIAGMGTHKELLAENEIYQQIAASQLSKEELEGKAKGREE
ncbi:MAG: ABC transporter ATP-binding protein [Acetivibrio sp.]